VHRVGHDVDERRSTGPGAGERDGRGGPEGALAGVAGAVGHVELDVVALDGQQLGAGGGIGARQIGYGHAQQLSMRLHGLTRRSTGTPAGRIGNKRHRIDLCSRQRLRRTRPDPVFEEQRR
jgi:hypothetical protein